MNKTNELIKQVIEHTGRIGKDLGEHTTSIYKMLSALHRLNSWTATVIAVVAVSVAVLSGLHSCAFNDHTHLWLQP